LNCLLTFYLLKAPPKQIPKTIDSTREADETIVTPDDEEVLEDEKLDEFADYFNSDKDPYIMITTSVNPSAVSTIYL
jgi:ribosome production factor 1